MLKSASFTYIKMLNAESNLLAFLALIKVAHSFQDLWYHGMMNIPLIIKTTTNNNNNNNNNKTYWVVHECLDAADKCEVELALSDINQDHLQTILINEPQHKTKHTNTKSLLC